MQTINYTELLRYRTDSLYGASKEHNCYELKIGIGDVVCFILYVGSKEWTRSG